MPRIYVATLSDYNNGRLHGRWIDLDGLDADDVRGEIAEMLRGSKFPNVTVQCPECEGDGLDPCRVAPECDTCNGSGIVPSAEEWAVHDYDDLPAAFGEHPDLDDLVEYVEGIENHGDAFRAFVESVGITYFIHADFDAAFAGEADSELEWVENHLDECGTLNDIPANLRSYFDFELYLRDMKAGGDISFERYEGTVYAFWNS